MPLKRFYNCTFLFVAIFLLCNSKICAQQDAQYTQYMYNTITINPAYTGARGTLSILALYRNQWLGIDGAPETFNLSIDSPIGQDKKSGIGLEFIADKIGPSNTNTIAANYSYLISLRDHLNFSFGLKAGVTSLNLDTDKLNIYDPNGLNLNLTDYTIPVVGLGIYLYSRKWYMGLSIPNLLETKHYDETKISTATEKIHLYLLGGYVFDLSSQVKLKPIGLFKAVVGAPVSVDISVNTILSDMVTLGLGYRWDAAVSALVGFQINDNIMIGYAYDYPTTELNHYNSGSHEIFLRFELFKSSSAWTPFSF